jgi:ABC-type lipoprotein export system ATPase subunit
MSLYAPAAADPVIRLRGVTKTYPMGKDNIVQALQGADLDVYPGEFVALMGPSGSGKSTMMNVLGCLDVPDAGTYVLAGEQVRKLNDDQMAAIRNKHIGFVFQTFNLQPGSTPENVELLLLCGTARGRTAREGRAGGRPPAMHHRPSEQGGQQQRVAIARSLNDPSIIPAGNPTGISIRGPACDLCDLPVDRTTREDRAYGDPRADVAEHRKRTAMRDGVSGGSLFPPRRGGRAPPGGPRATGRPADGTVTTEKRRKRRDEVLCSIPPGFALRDHRQQARRVHDARRHHHRRRIGHRVIAGQRRVDPVSSRSRRSIGP